MLKTVLRYDGLIESYEAWLQSITNNAEIETVSPEWVLTDTFFAVDSSDEIVGIIDLRHDLNEFLKDFGNIGYSVRPSERRKGYATEMLRLIKDVAKRVGLDSLQLSVECSNEPSVKTIKKMVGYTNGASNLKEKLQMYIN